MAITVTDLFCGAGGSSTGAVQVPGVSVRVASNHWQKAVDTHNTNHPAADHICADLTQIDPRYFPTTTMLWGSPECTYHTIARGRKQRQDGVGPDLFGGGLPDEAAQRSRATMWDIPRFAEVHQYQAVIVENVVDAANWLPFRSWLMAMDSLGYDHQIVYLNSMHAWALGDPAPQSRDRIYIVFWRKGNQKPDLERMQRPPAWCPMHGKVAAMQAFKNPARRWGRYRAQYVYRCPQVECRNQIVEPAWLPAASIIDWTDTGTRIGDRTRPLAAKTMTRIQAGIDRYWGQPLAVPVEGREGKDALPLSAPARTQTTRNETGLAFPPMMHLEAAGNTYNAASPQHPAHDRADGYYRVWPGTEPVRTVHTTASKAVAFPPFIAELRGGGSDARSCADPLSTVTASGNHHALIMRNNSGGAEMSTPTTEPVRTITTAGHQSLITQGQTIRIEDCYFRMLHPAETKRAMAFPDQYVLLGTKREQVRMAGNAVTPPTARDLIGAVVATLS